MGSGSTAIACMNSGRDFVGYEVDPTYHAESVQSVEQHALAMAA